MRWGTPHTGHPRLSAAAGATWGLVSRGQQAFDTCCWSQCCCLSPGGKPAATRGPGCREAPHESGQGNGPCSVTASRMARPPPPERCRPRLPDLGEHDSAKLAVARPRTCLSGTRTAALSASRAQSTGAGLQASLCARGPRGPVGASAASRLLVGKASALPSPAPAPLRTRWEQPCRAVLRPLSGADTKGHSPAGHGTFPGRHRSVRCAEGLGSHGRCPGLRGTTGPAVEPCDSQPCELVRGRPGVAGDPPPRA